MAKGIAVIIGTEFDAKGLRAAQREIDRAAKQLQGTVGPTMTKLGGQMKTVGQKMSSVGRGMTVGVTLPLVAIGAAAINTQKNFEVAMSQLRVATSATGTEMQSMSDLAKQMGADTVYSATESANAMLELAKQGFTPAEISGGALQSTMSLAATEGIGLADSATIIARAMNTFGIQAADAGKVVDQLAAGSVASSAGVQDLAAGMKYVGSTAATMHLGVGDVVTALAQLNDAGLDASTAGTSLNRMLLGLAGTTKRGQDVIAEYGLSFYDATGKMRPMVDIVGQLQNAFGGLDDPTRTAALKDLFGVEGMRAANVLIQQGTQGWQDMSAAVDQAGKAQEMADARMSGTAGAIERIKGAFESVALTIGEVLAPYVEKAADFIQQLADKFNELPDSAKATIVAVGAIAAAIGPMLILLGPLISGIGSLVSTIGGMVTAGTAGTGVLASLGGTLGALAGPVGIALAAIAAVAAGFAALWANSETLRTAVATAFGAIKDAISQAVTFISAKLQEHADEIEMVKEALRQLGDFVGTYIVPLLQGALVAAIQKVASWLGAMIDTVSLVIDGLDALARALDPVAQWLGLGTGAANDFADAQTNMAIGGGDFAAVLSGSEQARSSYLTWAQNAATDTQAVADATNALTAGLDAIDAALAHQQAMTDYKDALKAYIEDPTQETATKVEEAMSQAGRSFKDPADGAGFVVDAIGKIKQVANDAGLKLPPGVKAAMDDFVTSAQAGDTTVQNLKSRMEGLTDKEVKITVVTQHVTLGDGSYFGSGDAYGGATGGPIHAATGRVIGPGTHASDSVPAMLSVGEYVMNAHTVKRLGVGYFNRLNNGGKSDAVGGGITVNVQAAPGERAEESVPRALRRFAFVAGLNG